MRIKWAVHRTRMCVILWIVAQSIDHQESKQLTFEFKAWRAKLKLKIFELKFYSRLICDFFNQWFDLHALLSLCRVSHTLSNVESDSFQFSDSLLHLHAKFFYDSVVQTVRFHISFDLQEFFKSCRRGEWKCLGTDIRNRLRLILHLIFDCAIEFARFREVLGEDVKLVKLLVNLHD